MRVYDITQSVNNQENYSREIANLVGRSTRLNAESSGNEAHLQKIDDLTRSIVFIIFNEDRDRALYVGYSNDGLRGMVIQSAYHKLITKLHVKVVLEIIACNSTTYDWVDCEPPDEKHIYDAEYVGGVRLAMPCPIDLGREKFYNPQTGKWRKHGPPISDETVALKIALQFTLYPLYNQDIDATKFINEARKCISSPVETYRELLSTTSWRPPASSNCNTIDELARKIEYTLKSATAREQARDITTNADRLSRHIDRALKKIIVAAKKRKDAGFPQ